MNDQRFRKVWALAAEMFHEGYDLSDNPYEDSSEEFTEWRSAYLEEQREWADNGEPIPDEPADGFHPVDAVF